MDPPSPSPADDAAGAMEEVDPKEYEVYEALFREHRLHSVPSAVLDETGRGTFEAPPVPGGIPGPMRYKIQKVSASGLIEDFNARNQSPRRIGERFFAGGGRTQVSRVQTQRPVEGGYFVLSRVGFSASEKLALVHVCMYGGRLMAIGYMVLLTWGESGWQGVERVETWVS